MFDIYTQEKIKRIAKKWHGDRYEWTSNDLNQMLHDIWKITK